MPLNRVTVTGTFDDGSGAALSGYVTFTPSQAVYASGIPVLQPDVPVTAQISGGQLEATALVATDNAGLSVLGQTGFWFWSVTVVIGGETLPEWSCLLPHASLGNGPVDLYSLANTPAGGGGFTSPMTTLGDLIYENATPAAARLAGDASNTRKFLRTQASGGIAQAPAWDTIQAGDVPSLPYDASGAAATALAAAQAYADTSKLAKAANLSDLASAPTARTSLGLGSAAVQPASAFDAAGAAAAAQAAAEAYSSPSTALGDLVYGGGSGVPARLAGSTAAARKFLRQLGTGSSSAAPAWDTLTASDIAAAFPWQFLPETYGAEGDGKVLGDCSITASQAVLSSASYTFTSADVGKKGMLNGALGTGSGPLIFTVGSVSGGNATLSGTASVTISGNGACIFGTDDTAALAACETAAGAYATAHDYYAEILLQNIYIAAGAPVQSASPQFNTQIPVPYPALNGASRKMLIRHIGPGLNDHCEFWESTCPNVLPGSVVSLAVPGGEPDGAFGYQSVIGGPSAGGAFAGGFANVKITFEGIGIWVPVLTNLMGADLGYAGGCHWDGSSVKPFAPANAGVRPYLSDLPANSTFLNSASVGVRFPLVGNNDDVTVPSFACEGFETGFWAADHFAGGRIATVYVDVGAVIDLTHSLSADAHGITIGNWSCENYNGALTCNGGGTGYCAVNISLDTETVSGSDPVYDVRDNGNLHGVIRISDNGGRTSRRPVIVNGAPNLTVINDMIGPGHWAAAPGVPGSTTPQQNTAWRPASIVVHAGAGVTVSAITVDGTPTGLTMAASSSLALPVLPGGKNIVLTYSGGTPTWDWWLA